MKFSAPIVFPFDLIWIRQDTSSTNDIQISLSFHLLGSLIGYALVIYIRAIITFCHQINWNGIWQQLSHFKCQGHSIGYTRYPTHQVSHHKSWIVGLWSRAFSWGDNDERDVYKGTEETICLFVDANLVYSCSIHPRLHQCLIDTWHSPHFPCRSLRRPVSPLGQLRPAERAFDLPATSHLNSQERSHYHAAEYRAVKCCSLTVSQLRKVSRGEGETDSFFLSLITFSQLIQGIRLPILDCPIFGDSATKFCNWEHQYLLHHHRLTWNRGEALQLVTFCHGGHQKRKQNNQPSIIWFTLNKNKVAAAADMFVTLPVIYHPLSPGEEGGEWW